MTARRGGCRAMLVVLVASLALGCVGRRVGTASPFALPPAPEAEVTAGARPLAAVDYRAHFVGHREGEAAFADRVDRVVARLPLLAGAQPGDGDTTFHLDLTLTNHSNGWIAGLSGLACGLSFTLLPAYARDDFDLDVELRAGTQSVWRRQYHDAVTTVVHFTLVFTPKSEQPRVVVEDVVDDLVLHALGDLDASGLLARATPTDAKGIP